MIRINQLKMPLGHDRAGLLEKAARVLRVPSEEIEKLTIVKPERSRIYGTVTWWT